MRLPESRLCIALLLASLFSILFSIPPLTASDAPPQPARNPRRHRYQRPHLHVNPRQKWAEAIAVRGDKIVAVGDRKQIGSAAWPRNKRD